MTTRILYILPDLDLTATTREALLVARHLDRSDWAICPLALTSGDARISLTLFDLEVQPIRQAWACDPRTVREMKATIQENRPAIVHAWGAAATRYAVGALGLLSSGSRPKLVSTESRKDHARTFVEKLFDRQASRLVDAYTANSLELLQQAVAEGLPCEKFEVITPGVPPHETGDVSRADFLARLDLPENTRLGVVAGRLTPRRCTKTAIWAATLLHEIRQDIHLLVVGDGSYFENLKLYAENAHIDKHIHFLGNVELGPVLDHADCLVSFGLEDECPIAVLEAMAAGVPVVATDTPGHQALIEQDVTGHLIKPGDRNGAAQWLQIFIDDQEKATQITTAALQSITDTFSIESTAARYASLYERLVK